MNENLAMKRARYTLRFPALMLGTAIIGLSLTSCDRTRNDKGYEYFPDMAHSQAFETYAPHPGLGTTNRLPVPGAVSRENLPFEYESNIDGRIKAGIELVNPVVRSAEVVERGKEKYRIYCLMCHGEKGDGQGYLYTDKLYNFQPASLINDRIRNVPDGEIFHSVTLGYGVMGAHGAQISREDRWNIIHYIRQELQK